MKRRFRDTRLHGFCKDAESYYVVETCQFEYFNACDDSVLLCNKVHEMTPEASSSRYLASGQYLDFKAVRFIHQQLPAQFNDVNLHDFCKFLQGNTLNPDVEIDFKSWRDLLDFLHASKKFGSELAQLAESCTHPNSILSAFRVLGVLCKDATRQASIPRVEDNCDFFTANNMKVEILKPRDTNINLFIPCNC
jgi:hypothetical protein